MESRCTAVRRGGAPVRDERDRPTAASLTGSDVPEAGGFCSTPSWAPGHRPHLCRGCSFSLEGSPLTLRCSEATPPLFGGPLLAPHPPPSGPPLSLGCLPRHTQGQMRVHAHITRRAVSLTSPSLHPPPSCVASPRVSFQHPAQVRAQRSTLGRGGRRAGRPSPVLPTALADLRWAL